MSRTIKFPEDFPSDIIDDIEAHIKGGLPPETDTYPTPKQGWTCFHCGQVFKTEYGALLHFGSPTRQRKFPRCIMNNWHMYLYGLFTGIVIGSLGWIALGMYYE